MTLTPSGLSFVTTKSLSPSAIDPFITMTWVGTEAVTRKLRGRAQVKKYKQNNFRLIKRCEYDRKKKIQQEKRSDTTFSCWSVKPRGK